MKTVEGFEALLLYRSPTGSPSTTKDFLNAKKKDPGVYKTSALLQRWQIC